MEFNRDIDYLLLRSSTVREYFDWFKNRFNCLPTDTYHSIPVIPELLALRRDYEKFVLIDHSPSSVATAKEIKENLSIITFQEYMSYYYNTS